MKQLKSTNSGLQRLYWRKRNSCYNKLIEKYFSFIIPAGSNVIELGCGTGDLLNSVRPLYGMGIDLSDEMIGIAKERFPNLHFLVANAEDFTSETQFDYIIISDLLHCANDIQAILENIRRYATPQTKIVISNYSHLWEHPLKLAEYIGLKQKSAASNWLSANDILNLLEVSGFQTIKLERKILLPLFVPGLTWLFNRIVANLPVLTHLGLVNFVTARLSPETSDQEYTVSVIVPAKNEFGNIENIVKRIPVFGKSVEIIFIEGNSSDNTFEEMVRVQQAYDHLDIVLMKQTQKGKGNAVREAFDKAKGEVLMILDADMTVPPHYLPRFYEAIRSNKGEFINGCRLVYPREKKAMRFLNLIANKLFCYFFSYIIGQHVKDTLCGTKVICKANYEKIKNNRSFFGDFDPFGDFDLLLGAAKQNLKIVEIYIKYKDREYGTTQISRFKHGLLLFKMSFYAARKIKFI